MTDMSQAESIFFAALERATPAEQLAYLDAACGGQPDLRARVERLLAAHPRVRGFLEPAAEIAHTEFLAAEGEAAFFDSLSAAEGMIVGGRYKLLQQIGDGGMGSVWMAEQVEPISRRVALKVIKLGMDTREVIARFEAERQALAMMDHPNIAKVLDAGATDKGRPFFVMELVKGPSITAFCDAAQLGTRERLALFGDVCSAIQHAHLKGVIHRDIKPSNVMVTMHGDKPVVKVIDFGIAKATQGKLTDKTLFTRYEQFIGTPVYMSPEQAATSGLDIDTRSDIYALGILLYELLTGRPPFDAKSLAAAGFEEVRRIIREVEPPKPSSRLGTLSAEERTTLAKVRRIEPEKLRRLVEPDLDWIVMKAIEKDRTRRYETANGLAQDIRSFLADEPVSASPPSAGYQFRKFVRRNKKVVNTVATVVAVLVITTLVSMGLTFRAMKAEATANEALTRLAMERETKEAIARMREEALPGIRAYQGPEHPETLNAMSDLAGSYFAIDRKDEAIKLSEELLKLRRKVNGPEHNATLNQMVLLAAIYHYAGRDSESIKLGEELLTIRRKVNGLKHPATISVMNNLAISYSAVGEIAKAKDLEAQIAAVRAK